MIYAQKKDFGLGSEPISKYTSIREKELTDSNSLLGYKKKRKYIGELTLNQDTTNWIKYNGIFVNNLTIDRSVTANNGIGIVLPFDLSADEIKELFGAGTTVSTITSFTFDDGGDGSKHLMAMYDTAVTEIKAGDLYFVTPKKTLTTIEIKDKIITMTEPNDYYLYDEATGARMHLIGTYINLPYKKSSPATRTYTYGFTSSGKISYISADGTLKGFRFYMAIDYLPK